MAKTYEELVKERPEKREDTRATAIARLQELATLSRAWPCGEYFPGYPEGPCMSPEEAHSEADDILLDLINDPEVRSAFGAIKMWYS